jgi:hypothetical protein
MTLSRRELLASLLGAAAAPALPAAAPGFSCPPPVPFGAVIALVNALVVAMLPAVDEAILRDWSAASAIPIVP